MPEATLNSPVPRTSEAKYALRVVVLDFANNAGHIEALVQDATNAEIRRVSYHVPDAAFPSATWPGLLSALGTARSGETGGAERRGNFRILGFLSDNGYLSGVTLVP